MRKPGERMPVAGVEGGERPFYRGPPQTSLNVRVLGDVIDVVHVDERVAGSRPETAECDHEEQGGDNDGLALLFVAFGRGGNCSHRGRILAANLR